MVAGTFDFGSAVRGVLKTLNLSETDKLKVKLISVVAKEY
jgi:hypothetical protein